MFMHIDAKKIAGAGLLAAVAVVLVILSSVIETSSLFFLAAASFCVGIAVREWGLKLGASFLISCIFLSFLLAPNKIYCITFSALGIYILMSEFLWDKIAGAKALKRRTLLLWIGKYVIFNCIYIPILIWFPSLILTRRLTGKLFLVVFLAGQIGLFIFDRAYLYFQGHIWGKKG